MQNEEKPNPKALIKTVIAAFALFIIPVLFLAAYKSLIKSDKEQPANAQALPPAAK